MKVFCTKQGHDNIAVNQYGGKKRVPVPVVGNEYTVVDQICKADIVYYELAEIPPNGNHYYYYCHTFFSLLSDIDETELINEKELQK